MTKTTSARYWTPDRARLLDLAIEGTDRIAKMPDGAAKYTAQGEIGNLLSPIEKRGIDDDPDA